MQSFVDNPCALNISFCPCLKSIQCTVNQPSLLAVCDLGWRDDGLVFPVSCVILYNEADHGGKNVCCYYSRTKQVAGPMHVT